MSEQPDPGPGWRIASGDDFRDERCEYWCTMKESWVPRLTPKYSFSNHDIYRIPDDKPQGGIECIDAIRAALTPEEFRVFCKGNVIKCCWGERHSDAGQDMETARRYLDLVVREHSVAASTNVDNNATTE